MNDLLDLKQLLDDAADILRRASVLAGELSGEDAGRAAVDEWIEGRCPTCGGKGYNLYINSGAITDAQPCSECRGNDFYRVHHAHPAIEPSPGWPAMSALADRLAGLEAAVRDATAGEVAEAIEAEAKEYDRQSDLWDAQQR